MKITKDMIGKKVRWCNWRFDSDPLYCVITAVGVENILAINIYRDGVIPSGICKREWSWDNDDLWEFYEEPKKKKIVRMAPALLKYVSGAYAITDRVYENADLARKNVEFAMGEFFIKWPANDNMWVKVEVEE